MTEAIDEMTELIEKKRRIFNFIARDGADITYYQVAETIAGDEVRTREFTPLNTIRDHHPKLILTLDAVPPSNDGGIRTLNALNFLLERI